MWNSAEDFDFGDEDDVGALLAKARIDLAPNAHAKQRRIHSGQTSGGSLQQNTRPDVEGTLPAPNSGSFFGERTPTISSSSFLINQRAARSRSNNDHGFSLEPPLSYVHPSSRGQPLANVTNSFLSEKRLQTDPPKQNVEAPSCPQKPSRFSSAFKVPFPHGANSPEQAGPSSSVIPHNGALCDSTPVRQASNAVASTSGSEEPAPRRWFDAAEKGKRILSEVENNLRAVPPDTDTAVGGKQARTKQTVIPGPAGTVQRALAQGRSSAEAQNASAQKQAPILLEALPDEDFSKGPWLAAVDFLRSEEVRRGPLQLTQLRDLRKGAVSKRTTRLVVIVKSMTPTGEGDIFATVKDVTGTLEGTLHRRLLADKQLGPISTGTVLVLHQVAIFRPVPRTCYLNIMATNVLKVFPTKTPIPTVRSSLRAASDPALTEPSWDGFPQVPLTSNGSRGVAGPSETGGPSPENNSQSRFWNSGAAPGQTQRRNDALGESNLRAGDSPGIVPRSEDESPELPSLSSSGGGAFGDPDIGGGQSVDRTETGARLPSGDSSGCAQQLPNRPPVPSTGTAVRHDSTPGGGQIEPGRQVPAAGEAAVFGAAGRCSPEGAGLSSKRGRDGDAWGALGPAKAPAASARGPGALNVDIQQLLAGLDEEDWFLPGDKAPPPNKKAREVEESLPL